jgi:hypothetical protein
MPATAIDPGGHTFWVSLHHEGKDMYLINMQIQGVNGTTLQHAMAQLDLMKQNILAGVARGVLSCADAHYSFEVTEPDSDHTKYDLLKSRVMPDYEKAFNADPNLNLDPKCLFPRIVHHQITLDTEQIKELTEDFNNSPFRETPLMTSCTQEAFDEAVDHLLTHYGHIEGGGPGECPICEKTGWIGSPKHSQCVQTILKSNNGLCDCGSKSTTTLHWEAKCEPCATRIQQWEWDTEP